MASFVKKLPGYLRDEYSCSFSDLGIYVTGIFFLLGSIFFAIPKSCLSTHKILKS
jgi:hypothetical protein